MTAVEAREEVCGVQRREGGGGRTRERRCEIQGREGGRGEGSRLTNLVQFFLQLFTASLEFLQV